MTHQLTTVIFLMLRSLSELFAKTEKGSYAVNNAARLFDETELATIAAKVKSDYSLDLTTCERKFEELNKIMDLAMIVAKQKSYPWTNASNIIYPLIANAAINFGASCYPEIIQDDAVVKAKVIGKDEGRPATFKGEKQFNEQGQPILKGAGDKIKKGDRVSTMMNYQLLEQMPWWENDIDKEVHSLPILGTLYKKVYYDTLKKMPVSELIFPNRIVINNGARDIDSAIVTQIIELYPQEIMERIRSGFYVNFDYNVKDAMNSTSGADANTQTELPDSRGNRDPKTNTNLHLFLEQHTWMDLDEDGFLEPYIITVHSSSQKCVRIIPRFEEKDIFYNDEGEIQEIKACKYYVVRRFLPSFDGSFMGMGYGHLLFNMNRAVNTTLNQMVDAGHKSITGGGFVAKNFKLRGGKFSISPGEYKMVDVMAQDLQSSILPMPVPEPSPVMFTLLGALIEAGKDLGSMRDLINGEVASNVAPTTMMSLVEQGMKQFKSIYKRYFKSLKTEYGLLYDINSKYLTNEEYALVLDEPENEVDVKADFDGKSYDIVPVADVNAINSTQKFAQANFLTSFIGNPNVDQFKLVKQIFSTARIPDTDTFVIPAEPQVDPAIQIAQMTQQVEMGKLQVATQKTALDQEKLQFEIPKITAEIEKIKSEIMIDFANVAKIGSEVDLKKQEQQVKIASHLVDAEISQIEVDARLQEAHLRHQNELLKLTHEHVQNHMDREHEKALTKQEKAQKEQSETAPQDQAVS